MAREPLTPPDVPRTVLVTGISGNLGRALAKQLHTETHVVGIDRRPFAGKPKDIDHFQVDLRKNKVEDVFRRHRVDALIHLGIMHDPRMPFTEAHSFNVLGTHRILDLCVRHGVKKVVILSSANVYGPRPDNSNFLPEETPLMAADRYSDVRDLIELDMYAQSFMWKHPELETVILRPVNIVGPTVRNAPSNYLRLEKPLTVLGFDPMVQLIHEEDVSRALVLALKPGLRGVFNVSGPGEVPLSAVLRELGRRPIPVPHPLVRGLVRRAFEARLTGFPPEEVDHIQYLCVVDGSRFAREAGWAPRYSLRETIRSVA
ncbi:SDR family oxidoreductase [Anaeromyxobacter oryzae]|uniref:Epimerase n=1 Tax=Anaeromyxobacter oryzae TaxID=2918170 RepID=A0ABM7WU84_9BACT|nr:SDR family oxidoreductase [Anaeromyxobacter oryzae]BDG03035.1 epimerase [Anaeromyxobacter oryzae]